MILRKSLKQAIFSNEKFLGNEWKKAKSATFRKIGGGNTLAHIQTKEAEYIIGKIARRQIFIVKFEFRYIPQL